VSGSQNVAVAGLSAISGLPGGVYSVTVTDGNGCTATCGFTLCNFSLSISGTNPDCNGTRNGSIQVNPINGFGQINWDWNLNILDGNREPSGLGAGSYAVIAKDAAGCTANANITLTEPAALSVSTSVIPPDCLGDGTGAFEITSLSGGTAPYEVSLDGVQFSVLGALPRRFGSLPAGSYNILVRDMNDCETTSTVNIPNLQANTLDLGMDVFLRLGDSVRLEGLANFDIDSVVWTPTTFMSNPDRAATFVRPTENITYRLTAFDAVGCSTSDEIAIFVERQIGIFTPNAFSPNDDGINDLFTIFADGSVSEIRQLRIFDRWGALVYEQAVLKPNDPAQGWDGRFLGKLLNPGVFLFTAEAEYLDGRAARFSGEVMLMR
jgi:gliding motility-associated-like protein